MFQENVTEKRCDIKVWSGACARDESMSTSEKYRCEECGIIPSLNHEIGHEIFPHLVGDYSILS